MPSDTYNPSIDQGAKLAFESNFRSLAQQKQTKLESSRAVSYLPSDAKTQHITRMGRLELDEVAGRNPNKSYGDYALDNRRLTKRRFTKTITIDKLYDINELIADPSSPILMELGYAKNRTIDRVIAAAAGGSVLVGAPDAAASSISAATDGVITVDGTSGVDYSVVQTVTQKFINNDLEYSMFQGSVFCVTGKENTALMNDTKFISNDYISSRPVEEGIIRNAGTYEVALFAGSENGGISVSSPILTEAGSTRSNLVLAPDSVALSMEIGDISVERNPNKVNSMDITIDLWINAMRTEGARVIIVSSTI